LVNYLLCLGWSPGEDREVIDIGEAVKIFEISDANKTAAIFDWDKLNWINNQYIKNASTGKLVDLLIPMIRKKFPQAESYYADRQRLEALVKLYQGRINTLSDFLDWADFFFLNKITIEQKLRDKFLSLDLSKEFSMFIERLESLRPFTSAGVEKTFRDLVKELNISSRQLIHPIRVALTGKTIGPGLFDVIAYLGKEVTKERLKSCFKNGG